MYYYESMKRTLVTVGALVILGAGGYFAYERFKSPPSSLQLVTATISRGNVVAGIDATGRLQAVRTVQVGSQVSGTIKALNADFNSVVKRGQVVAELEPSLFETQVEQAEATVTRMRADLERSRVQVEDAQLKLARARDLAERQLLPKADLETAEANSRTAQAAVKSAEAQLVQGQASLNQNKVNLSHTVIAAPIDGVVISRNVDVGQTVAASMQAPTLFEIANDLTQMQVNANIDEADIGQIQPGQPVRFQVDAYPGQTFTGVVAQVRLNPVIEQNVVSYVTVISVPNPEMRLRPGMTANVTVEVAREDNTLLVPSSAVRFSPTPELFAQLGQPVPEPLTAATSRRTGEDAPATATITPGNPTTGGREGGAPAGAPAPPTPVARAVEGVTTSARRFARDCSRCRRRNVRRSWPLEEAEVRVAGEVAGGEAVTGAQEEGAGPPAGVVDETMVAKTMCVSAVPHPVRTGARPARCGSSLMDISRPCPYASGSAVAPPSRSPEMD